MVQWKMASPNTSYPFKYYAIFHWTMMMEEPGCIPSMTLPHGFAPVSTRGLCARDLPGFAGHGHLPWLAGSIGRCVRKNTRGGHKNSRWATQKNILVGCLGYMSGMKLLPSLCENYFINHEIRIPSLNNQFFYGSSIRRFFFRVSDGGMGSFAWIYVFSCLPC